MHKKSLFYIVLAGVFWGTAVIFKNTLQNFGFTSIQINAMRGIISAIVLTLYVFITNRKGFKVPFKELLLFLANGVTVFLTGVAYYESMVYTTSATAVVLMYTAPIFVMFVSVLFMGEKLTKAKMFAVLLTVAGCGLISGIVGGAKFNTYGFLMGILSGILYATYNVLSKVIMNRGNNALVATMYGFIAGAVFGIILGNPGEIIKNISVDAVNILPWAVGVGICTSALPYFLYTLASKKLPASVASALSSIEPLTASIISFTIYSEQAGVQSVLGIVAIVTAVILLSRNDNKKSIKQ